jgi:hypothetical protein
VRRLLEEEDAAAGLRLLAGLGVPWAGDASALAVIDQALAEHGVPDVPRWAARLAAAVTPGGVEGAALPGWAIATAQGVRRGAEVAAAVEQGAPASAWDRVLAPLRPPGHVGALTTGRPEVGRWWRGDRLRRADIDGSDLVAAGVAPGPSIGRALAAVRAALLDGAVETRESQLQLALRVAREEG